MRVASCRAADACTGFTGAAAPARASGGYRRTIPLGDRGQCVGSPVQGERAKPEMGGGFHLHLDSRRMALRGSRDRPVLTPGGGLVDERCDDRPTGRRRAHDGDLAPWQAKCLAAPFRPGQPINQRAVSEAHGR